VIVAVLGNLGYRLVRELVRAGETVVAIEQRENGEFVCATREEAAVVLGNARAADTLRRAGVAGARIFVASTDDDLANLSSGLAARRARPDARVVLRVFDAQLAERLLGQVDVDAVLSVSAAAAPTFVGCALCPDARQGLLLKEGLVLIFHRSVRSVEKPAEAGEVPLLVRRGNASYQTAGATHAAQPGDEWIGSRWLPFAERPAAP
jgi:Trk K+ transport system NAD-binding subunit